MRIPPPQAVFEAFERPVQLRSTWNRTTSTPTSTNWSTSASSTSANGARPTAGDGTRAVGRLRWEATSSNTASRTHAPRTRVQRRLLVASSLLRSRVQDFAFYLGSVVRIERGVDSTNDFANLLSVLLNKYDSRMRYPFGLHER